MSQAAQKDLSEIAVQHPGSLFPSPSEWAMLKEQATMAVKSGLLPAGIDTAEKAIVIALKGRELGIPVMHAFSHIHVINGKPGASAELQLALIYKNCPGAIIDYIETSAERCEVSAKRPGGKSTQFSFTIADARNAGLSNKDGWKKYPAAMLRARVVSIAARALFADAIMGCSHTAEELGADVDGDGLVIQVPSEPIPPKAVSVSEPPAKTNPTKIRTKKIIGTEIMETAEKMRLSESEMKEWAREQSGVEAAQMNIAQLEKFLETLQWELGRKGEINE